MKKEKNKKVIKKLKCNLICPKCHEKFAEMKFAYGAQIEPEDITVLKGDKKSFAKDEDLACTCCAYPFLTWDIYLAIAEAEKNEKAV